MTSFPAVSLFQYHFENWLTPLYHMYWVAWQRWCHVTETMHRLGWLVPVQHEAVTDFVLFWFLASPPPTVIMALRRASPSYVIPLEDIAQEITSVICEPRAVLPRQSSHGEQFVLPVSVLVSDNGETPFPRSSLLVLSFFLLDLPLPVALFVFVCFFVCLFGCSSFFFFICIPVLVFYTLCLFSPLLSQATSLAIDCACCGYWWCDHVLFEYFISHEDCSCFSCL